MTTFANRSNRIELCLALLVLLSASATSQEKLYTRHGDATRYHLGSSCAGVGDLDLDGYDDFLVGARRDGTNGSDAGACYVYSGIDGSLLFSAFGEAAADQFGTSVSGAGDVNADGYPDWVVGAPYNDTVSGDAGSIYVYSGLDGANLHTIRGASAQAQCGWSVAGAGDVDQDGYDDLIAGAPLHDGAGTNSGQALVISGFDGQVLYIFHGAQQEDRLGWSVGGSADVDADGYDDLVVGVLGDDTSFTDAGAAAVYSGFDGSHWLTVYGSSSSMGFGSSLAFIEDVNQDGSAEILIGAPTDSSSGTTTGSAHLHSGIDGSLLFTAQGDAAQDRFGFSISKAGDINGDGSADWIVGAHLNDEAALNGGSARIFSGTSGVSLYTIDGDRHQTALGRSIGGAGDVNGDGFDDFIIGAPLTNSSGFNSGSAQVHSGNELFLDASPRAVSSGEQLSFQTAVAPPGSIGLLYITAVDGIPTFLRVPVIGIFDGQGKWTLSGVVGNSVLDLQFQVITTGAAGVQHSNTEDVRLN